ncbi:MAG TPA: TlyA family RNA methyltransferase [Aggregatilineales bacterium]|nr:TlyA family RNA methyltransferase [Aggregatilineales bacterium]
MVEKIRLDVLLHQRGLIESREKARAMIMAGEVTVNGVLVDKPGTKVHESDDLVLKAKPRYVSRGGEKLEGALRDFGYDPSGRICADVGFTDCLLQHGAEKVYAIDVGYGILDHRIRIDSRVVVIERTNARYVEKLAELVNLVVIDASFISVKILLPTVKAWLMPQADLIILIKPQFEAGKKDVGKGGVVKLASVHERILHEVLEFAVGLGFTVRGLTTSPLKGPAGNTEFLAWLSVGDDVGEIIPIDHIIQNIFANNLSER